MCLQSHFLRTSCSGCDWKVHSHKVRNLRTEVVRAIKDVALAQGKCAVVINREGAFSL
ncbi:hypothetical protein Plhal304r1_c022g0077171 [Plasmopara halstedii]